MYAVYMEAELRKLEAWLAEHRPSYRQALRPGTDDSKLRECEDAFGSALPDSLRALYLWHDGQSAGCLERLDRHGMFQPLDAVVRTAREMNELAETGDLPHESWWRPTWVPFLWSGGGSYLCVDLEGSFDGRRGQILELVGDDFERIIWFPDVEAWLRVLLEGLDGGLLVAREGDVDVEDPEAYESLIARLFPGHPRAVALAPPDDVT